VTRLARRAARALLLAGSAACHWLGWRLNRLQWRLDGIPNADRC
jgi:hypothetical protein